jgi:hypothetical protein
VGKKDYYPGRRARKKEIRVAVPVSSTCVCERENATSPREIYSGERHFL